MDEYFDQYIGVEVGLQKLIPGKPYEPWVCVGEVEVMVVTLLLFFLVMYWGYL